MKTAQNTNKTVMNQYLTSPIPSRIESPLILSALLVGLLILTACGSAAAAPTADITRLEGELRVARTALTEAETAQTTAETAQATAERLQREAERLQGLADTARDTAITTRDEALTATSVANTERGNAITAQAEAVRLQGIAETARLEAVRLQGVAETARLEAVRLQGVAETDRDTARTAEATAKRLQMEAETAQGIADTAKGAADTAKGIADTAKGVADTAKGVADTAKGVADTAKGVADTAKGLADAAKEAADTARATAISERDTARGERDALQTSLNTANTNLNTANTNLNAEKDETKRLNQFIRPTYATWDLFVNPETVPNASTRRNQFLQTTANVISRAGTNAPPQDIQTLNLATTTFDGLALGGEGDDGVVFFRGAIIGEGTNYNYAGVFEGTDLGMPLTDTTGTAVWNGSFDHIFNSTDFTLHITFDTNGGTLDAFVNAGHTGTFATRNFIFDNVRFDTLGLITGDVIYGTFAYNNPNATPSAIIPSTLRGLIGEQGAVGVFVGEVGQDIGGAFVAHPTATLDPNTINFADWAGAIGNPNATITAGSADTAPLLNGVTSVVDNHPRGNFVQGLATVDNKGFDFAGTAFPSATVLGDVLLLADNSPSGVAFSRVSGTGVTFWRYYAGLLPGTNLGAPIADTNTSAIWDAKFMLAASVNGSSFSVSNLDFKMQVIFNNSGGTINSGTLSGQSFTPGAVNLVGPGTTTGTIQGSFGSDGLLYGTVILGVASSNVPSTLTGLIGVNGAVGAFVTDDDNANNRTYVGGFVAKPPE